MEKFDKEKLIIDAAAKVHEDWCTEEMFGYFWRLQETLKHDKEYDAILKACYKGDKKRVDVDLDISELVRMDRRYLKKLVVDEKDFDTFKSVFIDGGRIVLKRFVERNLTDNEIHKASVNGNYKDGKENILLNFNELSADSKKENLEAAIGAFNVYEQMSKAGISIEEMEKNPEINNMIGIAIHTDWLKRNMNHENESLKVPYAELDSWTKKQDLTVFGALLDVVKKNRNMYSIDKVDGFELPDYEAEEREVLGLSAKQM